MTGSADLMAGIAELRDSNFGYVQADDYYQGTIAERFASARIRQMVEQSGEAYRFRLAAVPVDVITNRCEISSITGPTDAVTARVEEIRKANGMDLQEPFIIERGFTFGDAYVMVWPVDEDETNEDLRAAGVTLTYQSPLACRAIYDGVDGRRCLYVVRKWSEAGPLGEILRAEVWYDDRVERFITKPGSKGADAEDWSPYAEDVDGEPVVAVPEQNWPESHDLGENPIKHLRNDLPYGRPEHADAYGPQDMITKAVVTQALGVEAQGLPERYRLLDDAALLESAADAVDWRDDIAEAKKAEKQASGRRRGPGYEQTYAGTKEVGEFTTPDPGILNEPIELWVRLMSTVTGTPLYEFDPRSAAQLSGVSRDKADAPLRAKERNRKRFLASFWRQVWTLALDIAGVTVRPEQLDILWTPPEVVSDPEWWATAKVRQEAGVPQRQILLEANYLPEDIDAWLEEQEDNLALTSQVDLLERLGAAVQALGAGVATGVMSQENVADLVERIVGIRIDPEPPAPQPVALVTPPGQDPAALPPGAAPVEAEQQ